MARVNLTVGRVEKFECPAGKSQAFLWDARARGLAVRATPGGSKAFVFQSRLRDGSALRVTIGEPMRNDGSGTWSIPRAQEEARRLQGLIDQGSDPRIERAAKAAEHAAAREANRQARAREQVRGLDAWDEFLEDRRPRWGERHYSDHLKMAAAGGELRKRLPGVRTQPGPLRCLLDQPLARIDAEAVEDWVARESKTRPARAALGFRLLVVFFGWLAEHPQYRRIAHSDACSSKRVRERVVKPSAKQDCIQREQLHAWFREVCRLNPVPSAYLQSLLLTGARREELAALRWEDIDLTWRSVRIRDKVEGHRTIPLTPHVGALLLNLRNLNGKSVQPETLHRVGSSQAARPSLEPAPSPWVFFSKTSASGRLVEPRIAHNQALKAAGLPECTLHGLRRSFASLAEWTEMPAGVAAQIMGHKPSALAERHYKRRPLDLLRSWHDQFERWVLTEAGIEQPKPKAQGAAPGLVVAGGSEA